MQFTLPRTASGHFRLGVSMFYFIMGLVFASWASRIPDIKDALHLSEAGLGGVLFAIPAGQMSAMALSGYLVSRFGSKPLLLSAAVLYPLVLLFIGAAPTVWLLITALFFFGVGSNMMNIAVNTQACGVERIYNRSIMATFHGLWSLGGFLGGLVGALLVTCGFNPLNHFLIVFILSMALLVLSRKAVLPRDIFATKNPETGDKKHIRVKPDAFIVLLGLIGFGSMLCEGTMYDWSSVYFASVIKPSENLIRLGYIASMCAMTCGRFLADGMVTRFGVVNVLRTCGVVIAVGLLLAVLLPSLIPATLGFLLVGFGVSAVVPLCYSLAGKSKIMQPGMAITVVSTISFFGFLLGPPVIGFIAQALNLRWSLGLAAIVGFSIFILTPVLNRLLKKNTE